MVLLHGLLRTKRSMETAARWLAEHGFEPHNLGYPSRKQPLERLAVDVAEQLAQRFDGDHRRVHFLTHSMGGIVLRQLLAWQKEHPAENCWRLGRAVLIAPPNRGSRVAEFLGDLGPYRILFGPAGQQLRAGPECLVPSLPMPKEVGVIVGQRSVGSYGWAVRRGAAPQMENDGTLASDEVVMEGVPIVKVLAGHTFIMNNREALEQSEAFFRTGRFLPDPVRT